MTLTHQDKRELNKKARAQGLPDLWPEAEEPGRIRARFMPAIHDLVGGWQGGVEGRLPAQPSQVQNLRAIVGCTCHPYGGFGSHYVGCPYYAP